MQLDQVCVPHCCRTSFVEHLVGSSIRPGLFAAKSLFRVTVFSTVVDWSLSCNECITSLNEAFVQEYSLKNHINCERNMTVLQWCFCERGRLTDFLPIPPQIPIYTSCGPSNISLLYISFHMVTRMMGPSLQCCRAPGFEVVDWFHQCIAVQ